MESGPHQFESSELDIQNCVQEMREKSNLLDILDASGLSSSSQEDKHHLGAVGEHMLGTWYKLVHDSLWLEHMVSEKLKNLRLVPEQQSKVEEDLLLDQRALPNLRSQQPFTAMGQRLIYSIRANCQAATILMTNGDFIADHCLEIKQATTTAAQGAFLPIRERDLFQLDPQNTMVLELDPS